MGCVGFQIQNSGESVFSEGGPACLVCPAMPSKQSCPRANADQRGSLGGEPIKIPTSLAGSICPTSRVQMIFGYSVGLLPSRWAVDVLQDLEKQQSPSGSHGGCCWGQGLDSFSATKPVFTPQRWVVPQIRFPDLLGAFRVPFRAENLGPSESNPPDDLGPFSFPEHIAVAGF